MIFAMAIEKLVQLAFGWWWRTEAQLGLWSSPGLDCSDHSKHIKGLIGKSDG